MCLIPACTARRTHGVPGGVSEYCKSHKLSGMVHHVNRCRHESGCMNEAEYLPPPLMSNATTPYMCEEHHFPCDIKLHRGSLQCYSPDCTSRPTFGNTEDGCVSCSVHAVTGMVNMTRRTCRSPGCKARASCGPPWFTAPIMCSDHTSFFMTDLLARRNWCSVCEMEFEVYSGWVLCGSCLNSAI